MARMHTPRNQSTQPVLAFQRGVMTLRAVLLLFTGSLILLLLVASVSVSYGYFRGYVSDQLEVHARDGATAVGLSLSNAIDGRDPVASALLIDAVFDSGRYLSVQYLDNDGELIAGRQMALDDIAVPGWFISLARLPLPVGEAEVVRGWNRLGKVQAISHPGRAYRDLWRVTLGIVAGAAGVGGLGLGLLVWLLTRTLRPLSYVEQQAEAISRRDFRQRVTITSTRELNQVTHAMNQMADDLGQLFEGQAKLIQHLRRMSNEDGVTGLASRRAFDQRLRVEVETEERSAQGCLLLIQLSDFTHFNQSFGQEAADGLLVKVAEAINRFVISHSGAFAGRRTGADFAIFLPGIAMVDALLWGTRLVEEVDGIYADASAPMDTEVYGGVAQAAAGMDAHQLLAAADEALRQVQATGSSGCQGADPAQAAHFGVETWRELITEALEQQSVYLWQQPMVDVASSMPVYQQVFARIHVKGEWIRAGVFVPMAERFGLIAAIDRLMAEKALAWLQRRPDLELALALGSASVASESFRQELQDLLEQVGSIRKRLWVGVSEQTVHHHRTEAGLLVRNLRKLGVPVIVDHFGVGGVPFSYLRNLPFRALRIDQSFVHNIDTHEDNRFYLGSVIAIAHSRGVKVFVTGVETASEWEVLKGLGIDGAMGYHLQRPSLADNGDQPPE